MVITQLGEIIDTVTAHANTLNRRWGFNRLPQLVGIDLAHRFQSQKRKWELACFECTGSVLVSDLERVRSHGEAMLRAYSALERAAVEGGHAPLAPGVWEFELEDGTPIILVRTKPEMAQVERRHGAQVWSLEEIASILKHYPALAAVKDTFPEAEVIRLAPNRETRELVDDLLEDIPFGG